MGGIPHTHKKKKMEIHFGTEKKQCSNSDGDKLLSFGKKIVKVTKLRK